MHWNLLALLFVALLAAAADSGVSAYQHSIQQWRDQHEAKLKAEFGWLSVIALDWLKDGENRVGSAAGFEVLLPKPAPDRVGTIRVKNGKAYFKSAPGVALTLNGNPAADAEIELKPDTEPKYDILGLGRFRFFVIKREDKLGVRIKDSQSETRKQFTALRWFPVDPSWRVEAKYIPWDKPQTITFDTAVGVKEKDESPGYVAFQRNGKEYRLQPVVDGDQLWFVMRDLTSGRATYGASRFMYADFPKDGLHKPGTVTLDFNKAENPPCVFTNFATCPLPPPQNRLQLAVNAGEQMYGDHH